MKPVVTLLATALVVSAAGLAALSPKPPAAASASAAAKSGATTYAIDSVHSSALFKIKHAGVSNFYGRFNEMSGTFTLTDGGSIDVAIKADSVDTNSDGRDRHIKSPEFFSATEFPAIIFKSTAMKKKSEHTYEAMGNLTFRGVSKPITITIEHTGTGSMRGKEVAGMETRFTIKRSDFGNKPAPGLSDEVEIIFSPEGTAS